MDVWCSMKRRVRDGSVVTKAGKSFVAWLPAKARNTLVIEVVLLVMPFVETDETEHLFRF